MTAHAMQSDRDRCLAAGMDGYLCKPVDGQELIEMVERMAEKAKRVSAVGVGASDEKSDRRDFIPDPASLIPHPSSFIPHPSSMPFRLDQALARLDGKIGLFREMAGYFFSDSVELVPEIRAAAAAGDAATVEARAHRLKGTLLFLGAEAAVGAVSRVETLGRSGDLADAAAAIRSMEDEVARLAAALRPYGPDGQEEIRTPDREQHGTTAHSCGMP